MKKMTKKMIALFMTLLMVAAMLPITASAKEYALIIIELNEPYFGDNVTEILPEVEIITAFPYIYDGINFVLYYEYESDEDAYAAAEKLKSNPLVKNATYFPDTMSDNVRQAKFSVVVPNTYYGNDFYNTPANVDFGKLLPNANITKVYMWSRMSYDIYFDVTSLEEACEIYDKIKMVPFFSYVTFWHGEGEVTLGEIEVTLKEKYSNDEVIELFPEIEIKKVIHQNAGYVYTLELAVSTLSETLESVQKLKDNPNVVRLKYSEKPLRFTALPTELEEANYKAPALPEVTVETALAALRITAGLSEVKNGVYDYRLADAIWQYDCDGDKVITVTDALSLLRTAAGLAA